MPVFIFFIGKLYLRFTTGLKFYQTTLGRFDLNFSLAGSHGSFPGLENTSLQPQARSGSVFFDFSPVSSQLRDQIHEDYWRIGSLGLPRGRRGLPSEAHSLGLLLPLCRREHPYCRQHLFFLKMLVQHGFSFLLYEFQTSFFLVFFTIHVALRNLIFCFSSLSATWTLEEFLFFLPWRRLRLNSDIEKVPFEWVRPLW